jgi:hypothetical protein
LSDQPLRDLAKNILHFSWHPTRARDLSIELYWKGETRETVDFAQDDFRSQLKSLVEETIEQVSTWIHDIVQRH